MKSKLSNQFFTNFLVVFLLSLIITALSVPLIGLGSRIVSGVLAKNRFPASELMRDDYRMIDTAAVVENGGSVQVVDEDYRVVLAAGKDATLSKQMTASDFTEFLVTSKSKEIPFHHDVLYNGQGDFWLIITFPASIRIDFMLTWNPSAATGDFEKTVLILIAVALIYIVFLVVLTLVYSRITARRITDPLRKLADGTRMLREGDYSARVDLRLNNEFAQLQDTLNDMAERIEEEMALRQKSEEDRRRLILDISHDLKNPMAGIQGYAELLMKSPDISDDQRTHCLSMILSGSERANRLLNELFEISQLDSPDFVLKPERADLCEALRQVCGELVPRLEEAGADFDFDIPEDSVPVMLDRERFGRIIHNLMDNAIRHNPPGTKMEVRLRAREGQALIEVSDDGVGIPDDLAQNIFKPFIRGDEARGAQTGGSGLGLSIARKIALAHGGGLELARGKDKGSTFLLTLPII